MLMNGSKLIGLNLCYFTPKDENNIQFTIEKMLILNNVGVGLRFSVEAQGRGAGLRCRAEVQG